MSQSNRNPEAGPKPAGKPNTRRKTVRAAPVEDLIKVHELARELRIDHQKVIEVAQRLGAAAALPKSGLEREIAEQIRQELKPPPKPAKSPATVSTRRTERAPKEAAAPKPVSAEEGVQPVKAKSPVVIIDVSNVAREERDEQGRARLSSFENLLSVLTGGGIKVIAIADASLWGQIDREDEFKDYCRRGVIKQSPARTEADSWILEIAHQVDGYIISRDTFRDRIEKYPGIRGRIVSFMVFDGTVMLDPEHPFTELIRSGLPSKSKRKRR
jgi:hypothetical protein